MGHIDEETGLLKLSWSKIRLAGECPQKMNLVALGHKSPVSDVTVFYKGNTVDQAMRRWLSAGEQAPGWMRAHVDQIFDGLEQEIAEDGDGAVRWKDAGHRAAAREECREAVTRLEPLLLDKALPYDFQPALRFKTPLTIPGLDGEPRKVLLTGEMDLLTRERLDWPDIAGRPSPEALAALASKTRFRVWDLKMTKDDQYWRKTIAQLVFYDIACICLFGQQTAETGLLQPMVVEQPWISFAPTDEDRTQMFTRIVSVAHMIWRDVMPPKESSDGCSWCEVKHACSRFAPRAGTKTVNLF